MQNVSSTHKLVLTIQQIWGSHKLNDQTISDHSQPKIIEITFSFPDFALACKKKWFIPSIYSWDTVNFRAHDQTGPAQFDHADSKIFWSTYSLCKFVSTGKKSAYLKNLLQKYCWLKNPAIWLAENILVHVSTKKNPKYGICAGTQEII